MQAAASVMTAGAHRPRRIDGSRARRPTRGAEQRHPDDLDEAQDGERRVARERPERGERRPAGGDGSRRGAGGAATAG